jgi:hypothetical protein
MYCGLTLRVPHLRFAPSNPLVGFSSHSHLIPQSVLHFFALRKNGGERGIRTLGGVSPTRPFQGRTIDHSVISPFGREGAYHLCCIGFVNAVLLRFCPRKKGHAKKWQRK